MAHLVPPALHPLADVHHGEVEGPAPSCDRGFLKGERDAHGHFGFVFWQWIAEPRESWWGRVWVDERIGRYEGVIGVDEQETAKQQVAVECVSDGDGCRNRAGHRRLAEVRELGELDHAHVRHCLINHDVHLMVMPMKLNSEEVMLLLQILKMVNPGGGVVEIRCQYLTDDRLCEATSLVESHPQRSDPRHSTPRTGQGDRQPSPFRCALCNS